MSAQDALRSTGNQLDAQMADLMDEMAQAARQTPRVSRLLSRHSTTLGNVSTLVGDFRLEASSCQDPTRSRLLHEVADELERALGIDPGTLRAIGGRAQADARARIEERAARRAPRPRDDYTATDAETIREIANDIGESPASVERRFRSMQE